MAYNIETIIAEKFESIISKNIITTRAKDFYDIYMLMKDANVINQNNLIKAVHNTFKRRNTKLDIGEIEEVIIMLKESDILRNIYGNYQDKLSYPKNVSYDNTIDALKTILKILNYKEED